MKVNISVIARFHAFDLAEQLKRHLEKNPKVWISNI